MGKKSLPPLEECTIHLIRGDQRRLIDKFREALFFPAKLIKMFHNTYLLIRHQELRAPAAKNLCPMRYLNPLFSLVSCNQLVSNQAMMKTILKHPRKDPESGLFDDRDNANTFLPILRDLFPEEEVHPDDFILTCNREFVGGYRQPLLQFMGPHNLKKHAPALEEVIYEGVDLWMKGEGKINATKLSLLIPTAVISKLFLGDPGPYDVYQKIADANEVVNRYAIKKAFKQPVSSLEKAGYDQALKILRDAIERAITSNDTPLFGSIVEVLKNKKEITPIQIKGNLFIMYFAGAETTAALLAYLIWQLGRHPEYQEKIYQELMEKEGSLFEVAGQIESLDRCYLEATRLFTPGYVIGRRPATHVTCVIKDKEGKEVFREVVGNKTTFLCAPTFAGRDPRLYECADTFDPERSEIREKNPSWSTFGDGMHSCPGQWLAEIEIKMFVALLIKRRRIDSFPKTDMKQMGYLTLKLAEDIWVTLTPR